MVEYFNSDTTLLKNYNDYQAKYSNTIRESDKVLLSLVAKQQNVSTLLDIGCSTGNFLGHLREAFPSLTLTGGDIAKSSIDICRAHPKLKGVDVQIMDITAIPGTYDVVVSNAVTSILNDDIFVRGMKSVGKAVKPGGTFVTFEWMTPFDCQKIEIKEITAAYPEGLILYFRPYAEVRKALSDAGFVDIQFIPFEIPIDLPFLGHDTVQSHTRKDEAGNRMNFRGILYQPWTFVVARKG